HQSSPADLDQESTQAALDAFQLYLNSFPESIKVEEVNTMIDDLRARLELKDVTNAFLYYKILDYKAAYWALKNVLETYPNTARREEIQFTIFKSAYLYASLSDPKKQMERYEESLRYYNQFVEKYPQSIYRTEADRLNQEVKALIDNLKSVQK
ncbi:MAG: outer membrane protein assembly factor BamD, partial [Bacteroidota bacterium]|nr:outer membrane protein assembly factor BamD [Bacteroidota bacterium]